MNATRSLAEDALVSAATHLVGQSRAFALQLDSVQREIGSLEDDRAAPLVEALRLTLTQAAGPGTVRHVERSASELLRTLCAGDV